MTDDERTSRYLFVHECGTWDEFLRMVAEIRLEAKREAYEECAKICEKTGDDYDKREGNKCPELKTDAQVGCESCEDMIREAAKELSK